MPLQTVVETLEAQVVAPLRGRLPSGYTVSLYGAAVLGGLTFATIFTLILVPAAFGLFLDLRRGLFRLPPAEDGRGRFARFGLRRHDAAL